jgi:hypothetical protein
MKKFAIALCLLALFPVKTFALSYQDSGSRAGECEGLTKACTAAARELRAARDLIAGYEQHIAAADERIRIAEQQIETLKRIGALSGERAKELEAVIAAEREQIKILLNQKELQEQRIRQLEGQLKRTRKFALIAGVAAVVGIVVAVGK